MSENYEALSGLSEPELLVQRYLERPTPDLKDMVLVQFTSTVERVARKFAGIEPQEDLVQVGYIGLLNALSKFDPSAGVRFSTYASHLIAGEIKHYLRDKSQIIRHPAWLQELRHKISRAQLRLQAELGRVPTHSEIAADCQIAVATVEDVLASADMIKVTSLDAAFPGDDDGNELENIPCLNVDQMSVEDRVVLEQAMNQLRDLEREVVMRFHFDAMSQTEIAKELGISCNYVSHILRQSMAKLRRIMTQEESSDRRLQKQFKETQASVIDDSLGVYTEKYFRSRLKEEVHRADAQGSAVSLVLVKFRGLEGFAGFYGKESVTDFLADAAGFLRHNVRRLDVICLYGKDGFGVVLPFTGPMVSVVRQRLMSRFEPWLAARRSPTGTVGVSVGMAYLTDEVKSEKEMIRLAEEMISAEISGTACIQEAA